MRKIKDEILLGFDEMYSVTKKLLKSVFWWVQFLFVTIRCFSCCLLASIINVVYLMSYAVLFIHKFLYPIFLFSLKSTTPNFQHLSPLCNSSILKLGTYEWGWLRKQARWKNVIFCHLWRDTTFFSEGTVEVDEAVLQVRRWKLFSPCKCEESEINWKKYASWLGMVLMCAVIGPIVTLLMVLNNS